MSHISNILTGAEAAIRASTTFAAGNIYQRKEMPNDEIPDAVSVYLYFDKATANDRIDAQKFTVHSLIVLIVFPENAIAKDELEPDVVTEKKGEYNDAIITALRTNMPNSTNPISNIYQVDYLSTDYNPTISAEIAAAKTAADLHRVLQLWSYHAYES